MATLRLLKSVTKHSNSVGDNNDHWQRFEVRQIEDLRNLVLGADLEVIQMAGSKVGGSLAYSAVDGVIFSSGLLDGNAVVRGVPAKDAATVGILVSQGRGFRACLRRTEAGSISIILPGQAVEVLCAPGTMYAAATLELNRLENAVGRRFFESVVFDTPVVGERLEELKSALLRVHAGTGLVGTSVGNMMFRAILAHGLNEIDAARRHRPSPHENIVRMACAFIEGHLANPIAITDLSTAAGSSRRTLYRAFLEILGEPPSHYVRRLRLHRIRRDLVVGDASTGIAACARRWGITEHGRMSGWYQEVFGEKPSATVASRYHYQFSGAWL